MKAVILCGGKGTRMREETEYRPKSLVDIGGKPIIWHIMKIYSYYGINDFILCTGYKGDQIKQYFIDMYWRNNDFTVHMKENNRIEYLTQEDDFWNITILDTGLETMTGGRLKQAGKYIGEEEFLFTYGDGLSDIDITELIGFHRSKGKIATLTGVHPILPFGVIKVKDGVVESFEEKPVLSDLVNGGFMVLNRKIFDYLPQEDCSFEDEPLKQLAMDGELAVYENNRFWTAVDTYKDIEKVNRLWEREKVWKVW